MRVPTKNHFQPLQTYCSKFMMYCNVTLNLERFKVCFCIGNINSKNPIIFDRLNLNKMRDPALNDRFTFLVYLLNKSLCNVKKPRNSFNREIGKDK